MELLNMIILALGLYNLTLLSIFVSVFSYKLIKGEL